MAGETSFIAWNSFAMLPKILGLPASSKGKLSRDKLRQETEKVEVTCDILIVLSSDVSLLRETECKGLCNLLK